MKVKIESEVAQLCPILSDPMDCSLPGSSYYMDLLFSESTENPYLTSIAPPKVVAAKLSITFILSLCWVMAEFHCFVFKANQCTSEE